MEAVLLYEEHQHIISAASSQQASVRADGQALTLLPVCIRRSIMVPAVVMMMTVVVMALLVVIAIVVRLRRRNHQDHQDRQCGCKKLHMILPLVIPPT
jgi:heme/copper-type cytochrome/quinol oxidase subunit 2